MAGNYLRNGLKNRSPLLYSHWKSSDFFQGSLRPHQGTRGIIHSDSVMFFNINIINMIFTWMSKLTLFFLFGYVSISTIILLKPLSSHKSYNWHLLTTMTPCRRNKVVHSAHWRFKVLGVRTKQNLRWQMIVLDSSNLYNLICVSKILFNNMWSGGKGVDQQHHHLDINYIILWSWYFNSRLNRL